MNSLIYCASPKLSIFIMWGQQESLEDLQRSFMEAFGADLAGYYGSEDPTAKKRTRDSSSGTKSTKRSTSSGR